MMACASGLLRFCDASGGILEKVVVGVAGDPPTGSLASSRCQTSGHLVDQHTMSLDGGSSGRYQSGHAPID